MKTSWFKTIAGAAVAALTIGFAPKAEAEYTDDCITFTSAATFTLKTNDTGKHWDGTLWTSTDKTNWTVWYGKSVSAAQTGGAYNLYVRGDTNNTKISGGNTYTWVLTGSDIACTGNIETLRGATGDEPAPKQMAKMCYRHMFSGCTSLTTAPALPATELADSCYDSMFSGCSKLTAAPELPATTLADYCYQYMFRSCTALTTAPELPATTLAAGCYSYMFSFSGLTAAPSLPAMTMMTKCYQYMFQSCKSLTTAPALPATTLAAGCYANMFSGCISLEMPAMMDHVTTIGDAACYGMYSDCAKLEVNTESSAGYAKPWVVNAEDVGEYWNGDMFMGTAGTFRGAPEVGTTYYIKGGTPTVVVQPNPALNTSVGGVYTNSVAVPEVGGKYTVASNATVDVVFQGNTGYFFLTDGTYASVATNTVTATSDPTQVAGPAAVAGTKCGTSVWGFKDNVSGALTLVGTGATASGSKNNPFRGDSLTSVVIQPGVTGIGPFFFKNCTHLNSVTGGKDLATVGNQAFFGCMSLETITLDGNMPAGMDKAVVYKTAIKPSGETYDIPDIKVKNYVKALFGAKDAKNPEWVNLGSPENQSIYETEYNFFQIRLVPVAE